MANNHSIPAKQLHQFGTLLELQANLSNREIGFCTEDKVCYMKFDGVLFPMGHGVIASPTQTSLFMAYEDPNDPGSYIYGWTQFTDRSAPYDSNIKLWSRIAGRGLFADIADRDTSGRSISDFLNFVEYPDERPIEDSDALVTSGGVFNALGEKVDRTNVVPGIYPKVTVNAQGAVTQGSELVAEDIPNLDASKINSGTFEPDRIRDYSIGTPKLEDKAVTKDKLGDLSVSTESIEDRSVTEPKLADKAVSSRALDDRSVITKKLDDNSVTNAKIADGSVDSEKLDISSMLPFLVGLGLGYTVNYGVLTLFAKIYIGTVVLEITGSYSNSNITPGQVYPYISDVFSDDITERDNEYAVTYNEIIGHSALSHPTFSVDTSNGHLIMELGSILQPTLTFDTVVYMRDLVGMSYDDVAYWDDDNSPNVRFQLIGALHRTISCGGGSSDYILKTRPAINAPNVPEIGSSYKIVMTANYMYVSSS